MRLGNVNTIDSACVNVHVNPLAEFCELLHVRVNDKEPHVIPMHKSASTTYKRHSGLAEQIQGFNNFYFSSDS